MSKKHENVQKLSGFVQTRAGRTWVVIRPDGWQKVVPSLRDALGVAEGHPEYVIAQGA